MEVTEGLREGSGKENIPKRHVSHRLGRFFILIVFIFFTNSYLQDYRCYGAMEGPT